MTGLPSDHPSVEAVRASLERQGSSLRIAIPEAERDRFPDGEVVRVVLDGVQRHALVDSHLTEDRLVIAGAYDSPSLARDPGSATDRLREWLSDRPREVGDSVLVDVLDEGARYGLREPGESVTYEQRRATDDDLASIARQLDDPDA